MNLSNVPEDEGSFPVLRASEIPLEEEPRRWLVEDLWGASAVGWIAGSPKLGKSWLGLDLAVSVATGTPCLGKYRVVEPGPSLIYLAEDARSRVRERLCGITKPRGLRFEDLDVHVITAPTIRLDLARDQVRLQKTARLYEPRLLVLDPLVRIHRLDENLVSEIAGLLSYLRELQRELDLAIVLVHHTRKNTSSGLQGGQGLRGTGDFHAWSDSSLYLRRQRGEIVLTAEHRSAAAPAPVNLRLVTENEEMPHLEVVESPPTEGPKGPDLVERLLELLRGGTPLTRGELREKLSVKNERLGQALERLEAEGLIRRAADGWVFNGNGSEPGVPRSLL